MNLDNTYIIFATPRSGSYLLCESLTTTGLAGMPNEFFSIVQLRRMATHWQPATYARMLRTLMTNNATPNGVFGTKIIWQFFEDFTEFLRQIPGSEQLPTPDLINQTFPNVKYIWIKRRDKVRQAISYAKALQTGQWVKTEDKNYKPLMRGEGFRDTAFHYPTIDRLLTNIVLDEQEMEQYFAACNVQPCTVVYEDFVAEYEETAKRLLAFLEISVPPHVAFAQRRLLRQANEQTDEWVERYQQMKALNARASYAREAEG